MRLQTLFNWVSWLVELSQGLLVLGLYVHALEFQMVVFPLQALYSGFYFKKGGSFVIGKSRLRSLYVPSGAYPRLEGWVVGIRSFPLKRVCWSQTYIIPASHRIFISDQEEKRIHNSLGVSRHAWGYKRRLKLAYFLLLAKEAQTASLLCSFQNKSHYT